MNLSFNQKVKVAPDTLINVIEGESVLLNLKNESYYGLDEIGTRMWELLTISDSIQAAFEKLIDEYDVKGPRLRQDLELISNLVEQELLKLDA
ncbi:MAG: PqqD family protein [Acidobacteria bacterium]|nr:PqqD family protein [Acidobacteriota bacterium]